MRKLLLAILVLPGCTATYHAERSADGSTLTSMRYRAGSIDVDLRPDAASLHVDAPLPPVSRSATQPSPVAR